MAGWNEIINSVQVIDNLEREKKKYLTNLSRYTKRNVIMYFSAWQQKSKIEANWAIDDYDRNGFMNALKGLEKSIGCDLILHTPGGDLAATKSIVEYLLSFFNGDLRVIIPHTAMSAGTMIACAGKTIIMGLHSNLGPIDPQINGVPANEYLKMVDAGKKAINSNQDLIYWGDVFSKYPPTFFGLCQNAINLSEKYVSDWLKRGMMSGETQDEINNTTKYLSDYNYHLNHNTRLHIKELKEHTKLNIDSLEADDKLQDLVLSIFHCLTIIAGNSSIAKLIENQKGVKFVINHK